ncbi:DUF624 domain-containing protein [Occultella kanbiaonis]|uniref:DUF624 domain-containing protein n=1 Tax=Occultella kanbiaonis TaxID=2675754 RepID=UPI0013D0DD7A|nr:DUF624 domain-containing protein [Occultella kanbiaonis]
MLNLIWWLQVLAGGVVLGLAPATSVLYHQVRSNLTGDVAGDDFRSSWARWRRDFWRAQARYLVPLLTVVVLGFYVWMLRGQALASTVAILAAAYLCWLMHLPAVGERADEVAPDRALGATQLWLLTLRSFAVAPVPFLVAGVTTAFALGLGVLYVPVALIFAVPAVPALAASLAARFVPDALLEPPP